MRVRITEAIIAGAEPAEREFTIWDSIVPGFGYRVQPGGGKAFVFVYRTEGGRRGKVKRVTLRAAALTAARVEAKALSGQVHGGADPVAERKARRNAATVAEVLDRFMRDHVEARLKPSTVSGYRQVVGHDLKRLLGDLSVAELSPEDVAAAYHTMTGEAPTRAGLAIRVLSSAMSCAEEWGLRPAGSNPARIRLMGMRRRKRLFSDAEVSRLLEAIDRLESTGSIAKSAALGLRLLFATGCRAGEILGLTWSSVDFEGGLMHWKDTKTGPMEKAITDEARPLLEGADRIVGVDWVCPGASLTKPIRRETLEACFERVMTLAEVPKDENASLHLIRHWFATKTYSDASIPLPVQMRIVGHKNVATAMGYAHPDHETVARATQAAATKRAEALAVARRRGRVVRLPQTPKR